jgi:hypothetical protein
VHRHYGKGSARPERKSVAPNPRRVFLNVPYDHDYEPLLLAFIAGLSGLGLIPVIAGGDVRGRTIDRIRKLIVGSRYSIHDISRVGLRGKRHVRAPRFNMPFELGLAVSWSWSQPRHLWYVFESRWQRSDASLGDVKGIIVHAHRDQPEVVLSRLLNIFHRRRKPRPTLVQLRRIYAGLVRIVPRVKRDSGSRSLFEPAPFADLVLSSAQLANQLIE